MPTGAILLLVPRFSPSTVTLDVSSTRMLVRPWKYSISNAPATMLKASSPNFTSFHFSNSFGISCLGN